MLFSVVIPTYNRASVLKMTLEALANQSVTAPFEVIVVDDGSQDQTAEIVADLQVDYPVPLHYFYQLNRKQGAARNLGARYAQGKYLVFLGDDTVPFSNFLEEHRSRHDAPLPKGATPSKLAVIGYTTWPEHFKRTRFLEYIGEQGWQFGFSIIPDANDVPFNFFYTSNISLTREFFLKSGGFDEDFHEYGWEDIELSWRLKKQGMRLVYHRLAVTYHHHPTSLTEFVRRQEKVGYSAWSFYRKHPEMETFLGLEPLPTYSRTHRAKMSVLYGICRITENWRWPDLSSYYPTLMTYYYLRGAEQSKGASR